VITGVNDVCYNVEDMNRAVSFYRDVLGLRVVDQNPYWTSLDVGGVRVGLHWAEGAKIPYIARDDHGPHAGACLTLRVDDVNRTVAELSQRGVRFLGGVTNAPWGSLATFEDPFGNVLKLMQPAGAPAASIPQAAPPMQQVAGFGQAMASALGSFMNQMSAPAPIPVAVPVAVPVNAPPQPCFKCGGSGTLHRTSLPLSEGCIFCTNCDGCHTHGVIAAQAARCPHCNGEGRVHNSSMPHSIDCIFCKKCHTCHGKGHLL
jgi:catechol 2,3-dioxygenase-like lactoylglutathione lyase family enzyme